MTKIIFYLFILFSLTKLQVRPVDAFFTRDNSKDKITQACAFLGL